MTKHIIVESYSAASFRDRVDALQEDGWELIPATVQMAVTGQTPMVSCVVIGVMKKESVTLPASNPAKEKPASPQ